MSKGHEMKYSLFSFAFVLFFALSSVAMAEDKKEALKLLKDKSECLAFHETMKTQTDDAPTQERMQKGINRLNELISEDVHKLGVTKDEKAEMIDAAMAKVSAQAAIIYAPGSNADDSEFIKQYQDACIKAWPDIDKFYNAPENAIQIPEEEK